MQFVWALNTLKPNQPLAFMGHFMSTITVHRALWVVVFATLPLPVPHLQSHSILTRQRKSTSCNQDEPLPMYVLCRVGLSSCAFCESGARYNSLRFSWCRLPINLTQTECSTPAFPFYNFGELHFMHGRWLRECKHFRQDLAEPLQTRS
jgi:hypothetical protein